jgi:hypothetical protein
MPSTDPYFFSLRPIQLSLLRVLFLALVGIGLAVAFAGVSDKIMSITQCSEVCERANNNRVAQFACWFDPTCQIDGSKMGRSVSSDFNYTHLGLASALLFLASIAGKLLVRSRWTSTSLSIVAIAGSAFLTQLILWWLFTAWRTP